MSEPITAPGSPDCDSNPLPTRIGRYLIRRELGAGGFGVVYLGHDEELRRDVAIKVPRAARLASAADLDAYISEGRILASLNHPGIVDIYDAGHSDGLCFLVSKLIEGCNLAARLRQGPMTVRDAVELTACVAEALHHAHQRGVIHRDVKPSNILLDLQGRPVVADFGLALRDESFTRGSSFAGTPHYMSPEQARGEGHRVDGRTDVFSLGVVFYEMLVGRRPFRGEDTEEVLHQIQLLEPRPLRQANDAIPRELERICLKAMNKRASDRYSTAADFADDLRRWQGEARSEPASISVASVGEPASSPTGAEPHTPTPSSQPISVVPKGLRAFDAADADFFLALLPGARDRDGLPESVRFWKTRIEQTDPDESFSVGLLYGPSGCGKSSLVKAGLMPRLARQVVTVYVESSADQTEARLLRNLSKACPALPQGLSLSAAIAHLRRSGSGKRSPNRGKVLIVLDQFEQWLHAKQSEVDTELVRALRQCDGEQVQALLLVRDDFWMAATRLLRELEVPLVEGGNSAAVDLFDARHANKVLATFGRAYGALPEGEPSDEQRRFLTQAIDGLTLHDKIIPVRLALFAEMVKGKTWTPATLQGVGGAGGIGAVFLEETFAAGAPPEHRFHQRAARAVLRALLPGPGTDLTGHRRTHRELLEASGYEGRPQEFEALLRVLDTELRLVTPTDPESGGERQYQLTHDYLVPSLREWLSRKQRETLRGRTELRLAELAAMWEAKPESRHLPPPADWVSINLFTRRRDWSAPQKKMMRQAGWYYSTRAGLLAVMLLALLTGGWYVRAALRAGSLVDRLQTAQTAIVPALVSEVGAYRHWAEPTLRKHLAAAAPESRERLHAALALASWDSGQMPFLADRLLTASPDEVLIIRAALAEQGASLAPRYWELLEDGQADGERRLRAACALAVFDPESERWPAVCPDLVSILSRENLLLVGKWAQSLEAKRDLLAPVTLERLATADPSRFAALLTLLRADPETAVTRLEEELSAPSANKGATERLALWRRQANAAAALMQMGRAEKVWPLLRHSDDPTLRSYLIHRLGPCGVNPQTLVRQLEEETDVSIRRALFLALGAYPIDQFPAALRSALVEKWLKVYRDDPDAGLHAAVGWLLRRWQQGQRLAAIDKALAGQPANQRQWHVNRDGQTFTRIAAPGLIWCGTAPGDEKADNAMSELRHRRRLDRSFALAAREVTVAEFRAFQADYQPRKFWAANDEAPAGLLSWYDAARYCRWLSEREGVPEEQMCYPPLDQIKPGMKLPADFLARTGYRLPTESEWEHACRAGASTPWAHGSAAELLDHYGWSLANSRHQLQPVAQLQPNDLGLFDLHGNAMEWMQDGWMVYLEEHEQGRIGVDKPGDPVTNASNRVIRGGAVNLHGIYLRSAARDALGPELRMNQTGFRLARTVR